MNLYAYELKNYRKKKHLRLDGRLNIWLRIFSVFFHCQRYLYFLRLNRLSYRVKEVKLRCPIIVWISYIQHLFQWCTISYVKRFGTQFPSVWFFLWGHRPPAPPTGAAPQDPQCFMIDILVGSNLRQRHIEVKYKIDNNWKTKNRTKQKLMNTSTLIITFCIF